MIVVGVVIVVLVAALWTLCIVAEGLKDRVLHEVESQAQLTRRLVRITKGEITMAVSQEIQDLQAQVAAASAAEAAAGVAVLAAFARLEAKIGPGGLSDEDKAAIADAKAAVGALAGAEDAQKAGADAEGV